MPHPLVLGIETSCDDTACAVLDGDGRVLASVVSSQLAAHRPYGGVVPEIASREHLANWPAVSGEALERAGVSIQDVDVVAATRGPGLVGALLVGLSIGKAIAFAGDRPFHAVHHLEGHLYSPFLHPPGDPEPPAPPPDRFVGLVLSGGHSSLFAVEDGEVSTLGETRDDAMGEVFDKVGKRLGLPYPQGPKVDELAERGTPGAHRLPVSRFGDGDRRLDFSYSGLKSQTLLEIERLERTLGPIDLGDGNPPPQPVLDLLAGFRAVRRGPGPRPPGAPPGAPAHSSCWPSPEAPPPTACCAASSPPGPSATASSFASSPSLYSGDNAAMIAHAALLRHRRGSSGDPFAAEAESRIPL